MAHLIRIAEALSRPLLFHPAKLEVILGALGDRLDLGLEPPPPEASRFLGHRRGGSNIRSVDGIALISIVGSLANRGAYVGASSGIVSYEGIGAQIREAAADRAIKAIILDIDSPGGEATGMFRLAEMIRTVRRSKRVVAYVDDLAASAAYGIASAATEIVISPTSIVGSIGVVLAHVDRSRELEAKGQRVTLIHAGAHKVDGNPFGPLSETVRADLQGEVMTFYDRFVETVLAGRPKLSAEQIRGTEAKTFIGAAAIEAGLADRVASIDDVLAGLARSSASASAPISKKETIMPASAKPSLPAPTPAKMPVEKGLSAEVDRMLGSPMASLSEAKPSGLSAAVNRMVGIASPKSEKQTGLSIAVDDLAGRTTARTVRANGLSAEIEKMLAGEKADQRPSGLSQAIDETIEQDRRMRSFSNASTTA